MGVAWGGSCRRPRCLVCHKPLDLLQRLLAHDVCQRCHVEFPIVHKFASSLPTRDESAGEGLVASAVASCRPSPENAQRGAASSGGES